MHIESYLIQRGAGHDVAVQFSQSRPMAHDRAEFGPLLGLGLGLWLATRNGVEIEMNRQSVIGGLWRTIQHDRGHEGLEDLSPSTPSVCTCILVIQ